MIMMMLMLMGSLYLIMVKLLLMILMITLMMMVTMHCNDGQPEFHYEYNSLDDTAYDDNLVRSVFVMGVIIMLLLMLMNGNNYAYSYNKQKKEPEDLLNSRDSLDTLSLEHDVTSLPA